MKIIVEVPSIEVLEKFYSDQQESFTALDRACDVYKQFTEQLGELDLKGE